MTMGAVPLARAFRFSSCHCERNVAISSPYNDDVLNLNEIATSLRSSQ